MHNTLTRLQAVFGTTTTTLSVLAIAIALLSLITTPNPQLSHGSLKLHDVQVIKKRLYWRSDTKEDFAHIRFDLDVDLSDLFGWNTKQVFLYITASYPTNQFVKKQVEEVVDVEGGEETAKKRSEVPPGVETDIVEDDLLIDGSEHLHTKAIIWDAVLPHPLAPKHENTYRYPTPSSSASKKAATNSKTGKRKVSAKSSSKSKRDLEKGIPDVPAQPGIIRLQGQRPKYQITDPSGKLAKRANATLELAWNIQPWVGALTWRTSSLSLEGSSSALHSSAYASKRPVGGMQGAENALQSWTSYLTDFRANTMYSTWRGLKGNGGRTGRFDFPGLKDPKDAAKKAGEQGELKTEKGKEGHRLMAG